MTAHSACTTVSLPGAYDVPTARTRAGTLAVLFVGVVAVSSAALFIRLASAPALSTAALRLLFASAACVPLLLARVRRDLPALDKAAWRWSFISGACLALHFATWIASLGMTSVASSVVLVTASPLFVAGLVMLHGEAPARTMVLATLVCLAGGVLIGYSDFAHGGRALAGDGLAPAGAAFAAAYLAAGCRLRVSISVTSDIGIVYPIAALILVVMALVARQPLTGFSGRTYAMLLLLALVPQALGHSALNWSLGYLSAPFVAIAIVGEPILATALAAIFLGEMPGPASIAGGIVLLGDIYVGLRAELAAPKTTGRRLAEEGAMTAASE